MASRTFVIRVSESPARVVVEDVRSGERELAEGLSEVATKIAGWLDSTPPPPEPTTDGREG
jgi:hypothetical protein